MYNFRLRGVLKPVLLRSKSYESVGPLLSQTRMEGNQFSVVGMNLHPPLIPEVCFLSMLLLSASCV